MMKKILQLERKQLNSLLFLCLGSLISWLWEAVVYWISYAPHPPILPALLY